MILLFDYPTLAAFARTRTAALRLDARAYRHIYPEWLKCNDAVTLGEAERLLVAMLGI